MIHLGVSSGVVDCVVMFTNIVGFSFIEGGLKGGGCFIGVIVTELFDPKEQSQFPNPLQFSLNVTLCGRTGKPEDQVFMGSSRSPPE